MPTPNDLAGFILKKEACAAYNRSFRQLGRDLDKAFAKNDESFLDNFRLRLEDGTVLAATEVSKEQIQKLRDKGLNPTWFVRKEWMQEKYGPRTREAKATHVEASQEIGETDDDDTKTQPNSVPPAAMESLVQSKDDLIAFLREENGFLRETLSTERQRGSEDRQLTRELHILLKNMQDRLLPAPDSNASRPVVSVQSSAQPSQKPIQSAVTEDTGPKPQPKNTTPRKKSSKQAAKKSSPMQKRGDSAKPKWYQMPTFKRFFS